jgi:hypothetical protein
MSFCQYADITFRGFNILMTHIDADFRQRHSSLLSQSAYLLMTLFKTLIAAKAKGSGFTVVFWNFDSSGWLWLV